MMTGIEGLASCFQSDPLAGTDNQYTHNEFFPTKTPVLSGNIQLHFYSIFTFLLELNSQLRNFNVIIRFVSGHLDQPDTNQHGFYRLLFI
jgi:hypothetical protein